MNSEEFQSKMAIAAALIASGKVDLDLSAVARWETNPDAYPGLRELRKAVDVIYRALTTP